MALSWRNQGSVALINSASSPSDAFERGAARRRGKPTIRPRLPAVEAPRPEPLHVLEPASADQESGETRGGAIAVVDPVWRTDIEAELATVRDAIMRLDATRVADSQVLRDAVDRWSADSSDHSADQLARLQVRLDLLETAIEARNERSSTARADTTPSTGRIGVDGDQVETLNQTIAELREQQETLAATLSIVSERLGAERVRTTAVILAGTAVMLIFATLWLLTNSLVG
jgi:uncharacterized coiled-coil protein SlyX